MAGGGSPIGSILGIAGSAAGLLLGLDSSNRADQAFEEQLRRQRVEFAAWTADARAAAAASGIGLDSNGLSTYLDTTAGEFKRRQEMARADEGGAKLNRELGMAVNFLSDFGGSMTSALGGMAKSDYAQAEAKMKGIDPNLGSSFWAAFGG